MEGQRVQPDWCPDVGVLCGRGAERGKEREHASHYVWSADDSAVVVIWSVFSLFFRGVFCLLK